MIAIQKNNALNLARLQSLIALVVLCIIIAILSDKFLTMDNGWNVLRQISVNICISVGMTLIVLTAGIDLSVGSVLALCGAITAGLLKNGIKLPSLDLFIGFTLLGSLLAGIIAGGALGLFNGFVITKFKVPPFVSTLAMLTIARGLTMLWTQGHPISNSGSSAFSIIGTGWMLGIPVPVWIAGVVVLLAIFITRQTRLGRYIYAIGGNENAAILSGISINKSKTHCIQYCRRLRGGRWLLWLPRGSILPQPNAGTGYELDAIAAVVIGGTSLSVVKAVSVER